MVELLLLMMKPLTDNNANAVIVGEVVNGFPKVIWLIVIHAVVPLVHLVLNTVMKANTVHHGAKKKQNPKMRNKYGIS
jgi:heme exporter protein D